LIEESELNPNNFDAYPVWCWTDDNEFYKPVLDYAPLPDDQGDLFIKVRLTCSNGASFEGSVIGYKSYHAFSIFNDGQEYTLNLRSKQLLSMGLNRLWKGLNREIENFFPVSFEANFCYSSGEQVKGMLSPKFWK
jgi:hypothetical protein